MKTRNILYLALGFFALSCMKEEAPETTAPEQELNYVQKTFTAGIGPVEDVEGSESRTVLVNGYQVEWEEGNVVAVFDNVSTTRNEFTAESDGPVTTLNGSVPEGSTEFIAMYPNRGDNYVREGDVVKGCYMSPLQRPNKGSFYATSGYMMAKADAVDNLQFVNLSSIVKFNLGEDMTDVKSITLIGNNYEPLSGTFSVDWNDGSPEITHTSPDSYVMIANSNGKALTPGDYCFAIIPVELKDGFTVILSKLDGTQVAKKTTKDFSALGQRNRIMSMKPLTKDDYVSHMNYFVRYTDGFDVTLGSLTINKSTYGNATLQTDCKANTELRATTGVFFVPPVCEVVKIGGGNDRTRLIIAGVDASVRSKILMTTSQSLTADTDAETRNECLVLSNLDITTSSAFSIIRSKGAQCGSIIFNNCSVELKMGFINMDAATISKDVGLIEITDSEIGIDYTQQVWMVMQRQAVSTCDKFLVENNVFYACEGPEGGVTQFYLMHANNSEKGFQFGEVICNNNTFVDMPLKYNLIFALSTDSHISNGNLFVNPLYCNEKTNNSAIIAYATAPSLGEIINNYYYSTTLNTNEALYKLNPGKTADGWTGKKGSPVLLSANPLSATWDPEAGTFGVYNFSVSSGDAPAYNKVGAQRADMKQ